MLCYVIKNTNINKHIYKNMFQINEKHRIWNLKIEYGFCYVGFAYQKHRYQQANIEKYVSKQ